MNQLPTTARLIGIGWYFAVCIVGGLVLGVVLDRVLDITPVLTLVGLFSGLVLAFYGGYRMIAETLRPNQDRKE